jgi:hypothetical protein
MMAKHWHTLWRACQAATQHAPASSVSWLRGCLALPPRVCLTLGLGRALPAGRHRRCAAAAAAAAGSGGSGEGGSLCTGQVMLCCMCGSSVALLVDGRLLIALFMFRMWELLLSHPWA